MLPLYGLNIQLFDQLNAVFIIITIFANDISEAYNFATQFFQMKYCYTQSFIISVDITDETVFHEMLIYRLKVFV